MFTKMILMIGSVLSAGHSRCPFSISKFAKKISQSLIVWDRSATKTCSIVCRTYTLYKYLKTLLLKKKSLNCLVSCYSICTTITVVTQEYIYDKYQIYYTSGIGFLDFTIHPSIKNTTHTEKRGRREVFRS